MIRVVGKTTNTNVFSAPPLDLASGASLRRLSHPSQHFLFGCFASPMQSLTAPYNSPLNNLWVGGSKEDGPPNRPITPIDHCVPPIGKRANTPIGLLALGRLRKLILSRGNTVLIPVKCAICQGLKIARCQLISDARSPPNSRIGIGRMASSSLARRTGLQRYIWCARSTRSTGSWAGRSTEPGSSSASSIAARERQCAAHARSGSPRSNRYGQTAFYARR
jgi:hypothetical protein